MQTVAVVATVAKGFAEAKAAQMAAQEQARSIMFQTAQASANLQMQARQEQIQAQTYELEQKQLRIQELQERTRGAQEETARQRELRNTLSTIDAIRASRGLTIKSPTSGAYTKDIRATGLRDIRAIRLNTSAAADTLRMRGQYAGSLAAFSVDTARFYRDQAASTESRGRSAAKSALRAGRTQAMISLLGAGASAGSSMAGSSSGFTVPGTGSQSFVNSSGTPVPGRKPTRISF